MYMKRFLKRLTALVITAIVSIMIVPEFNTGIGGNVWAENNENTEYIVNQLSASTGQKIKQVYSGYWNSAAITTDGSLYTWGRNSCGQLGNGKSTDTNILIPTKIMDNVVSVSLGEFHHAGAITTDGSLYMWGYNNYGQLGDGTTTNSSVPIKIMDNVSSVSLGEYHSAAITTDGSLYMWGRNNYGQLGNGKSNEYAYVYDPEIDSALPIKIMDNVFSVNLGDDYSAAITTDGSLYTWGRNNYGQLGDGATTNSSVPIKIMDNISSIDFGHYMSAAITTDGSLYTWGRGFYGQLGNGTEENSLTPIKIMDNVIDVDIGFGHTGAITTGGSLYMWGKNDYGQLGNGIVTTEFTYVPIKIMDNVASVSLGQTFHGAAITADGSLYMWGSNEYGQFGNGTTERSLVPIRIIIGEDDTSDDKQDEDDEESETWKTYTIKFRGTETDEDKDLKFDYSDTLFSEPAIRFNQKLVQASLALELSSWTAYKTDHWTEDGNFYRDKNLVDCFYKLGFSNYKSQKYNTALSNSEDTVAFGMASKEITNTDGSKSNLVAVAIRGGGYGGEWASNFNVGNNGKYAEGFYNASTEVYNYINDYIRTYNLGKDVKIWIVGYSRAAATANLTAARLNNDYDYNNIYCYTFATPQGYVFKNDKVDYNNDYYNIHNIINPADLVPTVAFSDWGFGRFGSSYYIKNRSNSKMNEIYSSLMSGKSYDYNSLYPAMVREIDDFFIQFLANDTYVYVHNLQDIMTDALKKANSNKDMMDGGGTDLVFDVLRQWTLYYSLPWQIEKIEAGILIKIAIWRNDQFDDNNASTSLPELSAQIYSLKKITEIFNQHYPEVYIAWVFSSDEGTIYSQRNYKTAVIDCPVDVYVYDSSNNLVASIVDNEIVKEEINVAIFGDQKRVYLSDDSFSIKLVGNDTGTMDYSIEERDADGYMTRRVSIYDLPLENGTVYTGSINDIIDTPSENYALTTNDNVYVPSFDSNNSTGERYTISVTGGFSSKPFAYPGEQVTVTAFVPNNNTVFANWETESSIVFDDIELPVATFIMPNNNVEVTAINVDSASKLDSIMIDDVKIQDFDSNIITYTITLPYGTDEIPNVTAVPANENAIVTITQAISLTGTEEERTATITVTAEDGITQTIYKVTFVLDNDSNENTTTPDTPDIPDTNTSLDSIMVNSVKITNFDSSMTTYTIKLPYGTEEIPNVTAVPANENAIVTITQATSLTGTESQRTAIITVTAADGVTKTIYTVTFVLDDGSSGNTNTPDISDSFGTGNTPSKPSDSFSSSNNSSGNNTTSNSATPSNQSASSNNNNTNGGSRGEDISAAAVVYEKGEMIGNAVPIVAIIIPIGVVLAFVIIKRRKANR